MDNTKVSTFVVGRSSRRVSRVQTEIGQSSSDGSGPERSYKCASSLTAGVRNQGTVYGITTSSSGEEVWGTNGPFEET